ncbi:MAG: prepilin peptidase [Thermoproteales archaeon]|nr:prepilin peptidase [Thermoproteales archaeon]
MIYIDIIKTTIILLLFAVASYMDIKKREIDDKVWIIMFILSFPITIYEIIVFKIYLSRIWLLIYLISLSMGILFSYGLYKLSLIGGADAKSMIVLSIVEIPKFGVYGVLPSLSIFINSILMSLTFMIFIVSRNIFLLLKGVRIFESYENSLLEKIIAFFTLTPVIKDEIKKNPYKYMVAVKRIDKGKRIDIRIRISSDEVINLSDFTGKYIWVSYLMPMILYIMIGYLLYKLIGCIIFYFIPLY